MSYKDYIRHLYGDETLSVINQLKSVQSKLCKSSSSLIFLLRCRDNKFIPKGLRLKSPVRSIAAQRILQTASHRLVKERISYHRKTKHRLQHQALCLTDQVKANLSEEDFEQFTAITEKATNSITDRTKTIQIKKFKKLTEESKTHQNNTVDKEDKKNYLNRTVVNISSQTLTEDQISVLSKGLKFVPTSNQPPKEAFITSIEKGLQQLAPNGNVNYIRHQILEILAKPTRNKPNLSKKESEAIKQLKTKPNLSIVAADKGKATVIIDTDHLENLVHNNLSDPTTYHELKKDPTQKLDRQLKSTLKSLRENNEIDKQLYEQLNISHPTAPYARAQIKIHKNPVKVRLLVCSRGTVFYNIAKYLAKLLSPLGKTAKSYIKDSADFCAQIKTIQQCGKLVSYDVIDLFTNIPRKEAVECARQHLEPIIKELPTNLSLDSIIKLLNLCIDSTYFTWNNIIYEQIHGLPMGSPISPVLTELYMTAFEEDALLTSTIKPICFET